MHFYVESDDDALFGELAEHAARELGVVCTRPAGGQSPDMELRLAQGPYRLQELLTRIRSAQEEVPQTLGFHGFVFQPRTRTLAHKASVLDLTDKESQLLQALLQAPQMTLSREALLKNIWGIEAGLNTHTLETHIYRLRAKFKELSGSEMIAATDKGYTMIQGL